MVYPQCGFFHACSKYLRCWTFEVTMGAAEWFIRSFGISQVSSKHLMSNIWSPTAAAEWFILSVWVLTCVFTALMLNISIHNASSQMVYPQCGFFHIASKHMMLSRKRPIWKQHKQEGTLMMGKLQLVVPWAWKGEVMRGQRFALKRFALSELNP